MAQSCPPEAVLTLDRVQSCLELLLTPVLHHSKCLCLDLILILDHRPASDLRLLRNIPELPQAERIGALSLDLGPFSCGACCLKSTTQIYAYLSIPRAAPVQPRAFASCLSPNSDSWCCSSYYYYLKSLDLALSMIMGAIWSIAIASFEHRRFAAWAVLLSVKWIGSFGALVNPVHFNLRSNLLLQGSAVHQYFTLRLLEHQ